MAELSKYIWSNKQVKRALAMSLFDGEPKNPGYYYYKTMKW